MNSSVEKANSSIENVYCSVENVNSKVENICLGPVWFPGSPLHGVLVHTVVEVVPGKGAVGIVLPTLLTIGNPTDSQGIIRAVNIGNGCLPTGLYIELST